MKKLNDLKDVNKYWCDEHNKFHVRKYKYIIDNNGNKIKTKNTPFFNCFKNNTAFKLSQQELFNLQFKRNWKKYNIKDHKKSTKSKSQ